MLMDNFCGHHASMLVRRGAFDSAGGFDETLLSYEDWDVSLRLAFHAKFLFNPGAVDVYNLSPNGCGYPAQRAAPERMTPSASLRRTCNCQEFKRKARSRLALDTALGIADPIQAWAKGHSSSSRMPRRAG